MLSAALALSAALLVSPSDEDMLAIADCLWRQLPAETQLLVQTAPDLESLMRRPKLAGMDLEEMAANCPLAGAGYDLEGIVPFYAGMLWLEPRLERQWPDQSIRGAWGRLTTEEREAVYGTAIGPGQHLRTPEQTVILAKLFAPFGRTDWIDSQDDELSLYLLAYIMVTLSWAPPDDQDD